MVDAQPSFAGTGGAIRLEERTGFVYFVATEKDPRERHLYRARLDGTGRAASRRRTAPTRCSLAPDARYFADTRSSLDSPPALVVSSTDGLRSVAVAYDKRPEPLPSSAARYEWVELKARDGAALYGRLLKPAGFDPAKRYPVIVRVYGGPGRAGSSATPGTERALRPAAREPGLPGVLPRQPRHHGPRPRLREPPLQGHGQGRARRTSSWASTT